MITGGHAEEFRLLYLTVRLYSTSWSVINVHYDRVPSPYWCVFLINGGATEVSSTKNRSLQKERTCRPTHLNDVSINARTGHVARPMHRMGRRFAFSTIPHSIVKERRRERRRASSVLAGSYYPRMLPSSHCALRLRLETFWGETINQVRRGEIDLRVSNAIGYLSGILLSAIEKGSLEERLATLEAVFACGGHSNTWHARCAKNFSASNIPKG
jgi:hypothetical protein